MELTMCCPTLFGLEGIVADELRFGGRLTDVRAENGRVFSRVTRARLRGRTLICAAQSACSSDWARSAQRRSTSFSKA